MIPAVWSRVNPLFNDALAAHEFYGDTAAKRAWCKVMVQAVDVLRSRAKDAGCISGPVGRIRSAGEGVGPRTRSPYEMQTLDFNAGV